MIQWVDWGAVLIANLFNMLITGIMLSRPLEKEKLEERLGWGVSILALPLLGLVLANGANQREWWTMVLPGLLALFCLVEFLLDYVFQFPFRETRWLGPYLLLFYLAQWGMVGYAFLVVSLSGVITLLTYFVSLGATFYSYRKVGHGL